MLELSEQECEELLDKEIEMTGVLGGIKTGRVVGIDPEIGITIVNAEDTSDYIRCLQHPSLVNSTIAEDQHYLSLYSEIFQQTVDEIRSGKMKLTEILSGGVQRVTGNNPSLENCAFGK